MPKKTNCLYSQVADALIAQINGHMYGKLLPSERALCEQYQVSRTTIRQALHLLAQRGYVDGVRGKGMVVSHPQLLQELHSVYNFHEEMRRQGKRPETHMVDFVVQAASGGLASVFSLPEGSPVYRMIRLRLADGVPMLLETTYLSYQRFPGIQQKELEKGPLHHLLSSRYGLKLTAAEETFEPILLRPLEAQMLKTEENALGMLVERISLEGEARVVEFSKGVSPARKFWHHITLKY